MAPADEVFVGFNLLDRQIVDRDGALVGKVDDVEFTVDDDGFPVVTALLTGQEALGTRIGDGIGATMAGIARRLRTDEDSGPIRIPYYLVTDVGSAITLSVHRDLLTEPALEAWLRTNVIAHIPGAHIPGSDHVRQ
jgi:sporulation protein YlmC with PRC-barrel domain